MAKKQTVIIIQMHDDGGPFLFAVATDLKAARKVVEADVKEWTCGGPHQGKKWTFTSGGAELDNCSPYYSFERMTVQG